MSVGLEHFDKSFLRNIHLADRFHPLFPFLLLLQQLSFSSDISTVAFRGHILSECLHVLTSDNFPADRRLNGDLE